MLLQFPGQREDGFIELRIRVFEKKNPRLFLERVLEHRGEKEVMVG